MEKSKLVILFHYSLVQGGNSLSSLTFEQVFVDFQCISIFVDVYRNISMIVAYPLFFIISAHFLYYCWVSCNSFLLFLSWFLLIPGNIRRMTAIHFSHSCFQHSHIILMIFTASIFLPIFDRF